MQAARIKSSEDLQQNEPFSSIHLIQGVIFGTTKHRPTPVDSRRSSCPPVPAGDSCAPKEKKDLPGDLNPNAPLKDPSALVQARALSAHSR